MENKEAKNSERYYYFTLDCYLDSEERNFYRDGKQVEALQLTAQEMNIMLYLCENDNCPKNADQIYYALHSSENGGALTYVNSIQQGIRHIRNKMKEAKYPAEIITDRGVGYRIQLYENTNADSREKSIETFTREDLWDAGRNWFLQSKQPGHRFDEFGVRNTLRDTLFSDVCDYDIYVSKGQNTGTPKKLLDLIKRKTGADFDRDNLFLIGQGGIGKTYALMKIMGDSYKNKPDRKYPSLPFSIFVELSKAPDYDCEAYGKNKTDIPSFIRRSIYRQLVERNSEDSSKDSMYYWNLPEETAVDPVNHLLNLLEDQVTNEVNEDKPCLLLLFDGLNEVSTARVDDTDNTVRNYVTREINHLMKTYPSIKFILTSRTEHNGLSSEAIHSYYLQGINDNNIRDYLTENGNLPLNRIDEICKNKKLMDLLRVPIFLRMFAPLAQDLEIAKDLTTRGSILRAFLTNREKIIYNNQSRIKEIQDGRRHPRNDKSRSQFLSPQMQHFILQFILPAIANEMEKNGAYQISRKASKDHAIRGIDEIIDSILPYSDGDNCKDTDICGDYGNYVFKYCATDGSGSEHTPESVAGDYLKRMNENRKEIAKQIMDYCVSTLGILVSEGKAKPTYSFIHQHFRDYFSALFYVNQMKLAAYTFHDEEDVDTARAFMKDLEDRFLPQIIREMIGEYLGENLNAPVQDEEGTFMYNVPDDESDRTLIKRVIDLYRGEKLENKPAHYEVPNLFNIIKDVRRDLSGSDFHDLDLRECSFSYVPLDTCEGANFTGSLINATTWFPMGHESSISSACFSHDDKRILSASADRTCRIWDAKTEECLHVLTGHTATVEFACFSHNDKWILSASQDHTRRIWDAETGECLHVLKGHIFPVNSACFSHDDKWIVTASYDKTCRIWNAETGECIHVLMDHNDYVNSACFSHNDKLIVSASNDGTCRIWDVSTGDCIHVFDAHTTGVESACFSHDDKWILSASDDHTCRIWDTTTGNCVRALEGHTDRVDSACFSHDDKWILSTSWDRTCRIWDATTGDCLHVLNGHTASVHSACFSHDDKWILSASHDNTCRIWDATTGEYIHVLKGHNNSVTSACFSHKDKLILSASSNTCRIWNAKTGDSIQAIDSSTCTGNISNFSRNGTFIVSNNVGCHSTALKTQFLTWNTQTGECVQVFTGHTEDITSACFSHDDKWILSASRDHTCRIWNPETGKCLHILEGHTRDVISACFSHDDKWILSASWDNTCRIWDAETGDCLHVLEDHTYGITSACFSHNDKWILSASEDGTCRIWDAKTGECLHILEANDAPVTSACFSYDDKLIVSTSDDCSCQIWNSSTGECVRILEDDFDDYWTYACFSHDNRFIVSTSAATDFEDSSCRIWNVSTGDCVCTLEFPPGIEEIYSVCFSHNDELILSTSDDNTCRIWNTKTGACTNILKHNGCRFACFSPDDKSIASVSINGICILWDTATGEPIHTLQYYPSLKTNGVDFTKIDGNSSTSDLQKEQFQCMGGIVAPSNS